MGKRKADEGEASSSNTAKAPKSAAKASKPSHLAKAEKSDAAIARLQALGKAYSAQHEASGDPEGRSKTALAETYKEIIAQAVARESKFMLLMKNPPELENLQISKKFLAALHLPAILKFSKWFWGNTSKNVNHQLPLKVATRAVEIYEGALGLNQQSVEKTAAPEPENTPESQQLRQEVFFYQHLYRQAVGVLRNTTDHQYTLLGRLMAGDGEEMQDAELTMLEAARTELRLRLHACKTEKTNPKDSLRKLAGYGKPVLGFAVDLDVISDVTAGLSADVTASGQDGAEEGDLDTDEGEDMVEGDLDVDDGFATTEVNVAAMSNTEKVAEIDKSSPFNLTFLDSNMSGAEDTILVAKRAKKDDAVYTMDPTPQVDALKSLDPTAGFDKLDQNISKAINNSTDKIVNDPKLLSRFKANINHFQGLIDRRAIIKSAKKSDGVFDNFYRRRELVEDNLVHVKAFITKLRQEGLLDPMSTDEALNDVLQDMFALVAVMYGCEPEGCLWLTVMDSLLEELASQIRGSIDPKAQTTEMQRFRKWVDDGKTANPELSAEELEAMRLDDRARRIFGELVRFYRGAVQLAFVAASRYAKTNHDRGHQWYENLLLCTYVCGSEACAEKLVVRQAEQEEVGEDQAIGEEAQVDLLDVDPDAMDIENSTNTIKYDDGRAEFDVKSHYGLSIGVKDRRMGFPAERTFISSNREWAYPCLYELIHWNRWHPGFGPFFHYFAHIYHPMCQPTRGKDNIIMQVMCGRFEN